MAQRDLRGHFAFAKDLAQTLLGTQDGGRDAGWKGVCSASVVEGFAAKLRSHDRAERLPLRRRLWQNQGICGVTLRSPPKAKRSSGLGRIAGARPLSAWLPWLRR